jgi:hypothetical protein
MKKGREEFKKIDAASKTTGIYKKTVNGIKR